MKIIPEKCAPQTKIESEVVNVPDNVRLAKLSWRNRMTAVYHTSGFTTKKTLLETYLLNIPLCQILFNLDSSLGSYVCMVK